MSVLTGRYRREAALQLIKAMDQFCLQICIGGVTTLSQTWVRDSVRNWQNARTEYDNARNEGN